MCYHKVSMTTRNRIVLMHAALAKRYIRYWKRQTLSLHAIPNNLTGPTAATIERYCDVNEQGRTFEMLPLGLRFGDGAF